MLILKLNNFKEICQSTLGIVINCAAFVAAACKSLELINFTLLKCKS